eukprot:281790-Pyramimonas_sp.AAC.1
MGLERELEHVHSLAAGKGACKGSLSRLRLNWRWNLKRFTLQAWERGLAKAPRPLPNQPTG